MLKKIVALVTATMVAMGAVLIPATSVRAAERCVKTSIIANKDGEYCDEEGDGSGIFRILNIVVDVLTMGVGVLATLGIIVVGYQYMTSSGDTAKMAKAKNRIIEIVLGLIVYFVMWAVLQWLIPGGIFG